MARSALSRGDLLLLAAILALAGVVVSAILTWQFFAAENATFCDITNYFSCTVVRESPYASFYGVPTSSVGLAGFVVLLGLTIAAFRGVDALGPWSVDGWLLVFAVLGGLVGLGLSFIEVFVIDAVCILCASGFALDLGILAVGIVLRRRGREAAVE